MNWEHMMGWQKEDIPRGFTGLERAKVKGKRYHTAYRGLGGVLISVF